MNMEKEKGKNRKKGMMGKGEGKNVEWWMSKMLFKGEDGDVFDREDVGEKGAVVKDGG